ncbi:MAG: hypothetical protein SFW08_07035 [Gemmatimonadaceae bacterium]|nr:hypothetical protein [Gemmatimonadaceae bacterium]
MLWRLLFPSWAFFDRVVAVPALEVRTVDRVGDRTPWRPALRAPSRGVLALLYHPKGTLHLAQQGVVDRFAAECAMDEADETTTALVAALARVAVGDAEGVAWQWRVVESTPSAMAPAQVVFCSDELPVHDTPPDAR